MFSINQKTFYKGKTPEERKGEKCLFRITINHLYFQYHGEKMICFFWSSLKPSNWKITIRAMRKFWHWVCERDKKMAYKESIRLGRAHAVGGTRGWEKYVKHSEKRDYWRFMR